MAQLAKGASKKHLLRQLTHTKRLRSSMGSFDPRVTVGCCFVFISLLIFQWCILAFFFCCLYGWITCIAVQYFLSSLCMSVDLFAVYYGPFADAYTWLYYFNQYLLLLFCCVLSVPFGVGELRSSGSLYTNLCVQTFMAPSDWRVSLSPTKWFAGFPINTW